MTFPLGIGIIGCGVISGAYLKGAAASPWLEVRGIADLDFQAARRQAEAFGVTAVADVDTLLADPAISIVVNLTIPAAHAEVSRRILEAGKHVYTEKPLTVDLASAQELLALAKSRGLRVGCAPDTFLGAAHQTARNLVDAGGIGRILGGTMTVMSRGMEAWHPNPDFFFKAGGGPILDLGPYYLTQLVNLLGPVAAVSATAGAGYNSRTIGSGPREGEEIPVEIPTGYSALLTMQSGARISFDASWDVWKHGRTPVELYGTEGSLQIPDPNFFGGALQLSRRGGDWEEVAVDAHPFGLPNRTLRSGKEVADYRAVGLADMAAAIGQDRAHRTDATLALHVLEVLLAIDSAAASHREVAIRSTCERPAPVPAGRDEGVFSTAGSLANTETETN